MPAGGTTPYDTAETVLQLARSMANDAVISLVGDVLSDSQPYTFVLLQSAYEDLQDRMAEEGINTFLKYGFITGLTAVAVTDPTVQVQLSYAGYYDGSTNHANPTLPADLLMPLEIWERQSGTSNRWSQMNEAPDSINQAAQTSRFGRWDWENDILYLPGATQSNDLKMKYIYYAPALTGPNSPVLIAKCKNALAALMVATAADARGGVEVAQRYEAKADSFIKRINSRTAQKEQRSTFVRSPFRGKRGRRRYY